MIARSYKVRGRVQGVGFRDFVARAAVKLGVTGFARNDDDGSVEVVAVGSEAKLSQLAGLLHQGPRFAEVRAVEERDAPMQQYGSFEIK